MPCRLAEVAGRGVPKRSLTGRRAPGDPAPQQDDPGRCEAQLDPLGAVPAFLPARVVANLWVEPDAGAFRLEHPFVGGEVLRVVQRRSRRAAVDGVARTERLHRRRARPQGAGDPIVAAVLVHPTADVVHELPERYPLIYSHARHHPLFLAKAPGEHLRAVQAVASWGGRGWWGNASRMSFMGPPLPGAVRVRERSSPRFTTVRSGAIRPSVRPVLRYPKRE